MASSRLLAINISCLEDQPLLIAVRGRDFLSYPYGFALDVVSEQQINAKACLSQPAYFTLSHNGQTQLYHGIVEMAQQYDYLPDEGYFYTFYLSPWFKKLKYTNDYRPFVNQSVVEIATTWFKELGYRDFDFSKLTKTYPPLAFTLQYNESIFNFISRLLECSGIYYYFVHSEDKHVMVFEDSGLFGNNAYPQGLTYTEGASVDSHLYEWRRATQMVATKTTYLGYNFQLSQTPVQAVSQVPGANNTINAEAATYIGATHQDVSTLSDFVKLHSKGWALSKTRVSAKGNYLGLYAGTQFSLTQHSFNPRELGTFYLFAIAIEATDNTGRRVSNHSKDAHTYEYKNHLLAYPAASPFVPLGRYADSTAQETNQHSPAFILPVFDEELIQVPIKKVYAKLTEAIVTGQSGQDIYTDNFGRVKIQFMFDRYGKKDGNASNWVRCLQRWAGNGYGTQFVPRIGDEVLVEFENGDPDYPFIIGSLYNADNLPPFAANTQSGFKSHTLGSSNATDGNLLRFDDSPGAEEVYIKAQKDLNITAKGKSTKTVGGNSTTHVGKGNYIQTVNGVLTVQAAKSITVACGTSAIVVTPNGVTFQADNIIMQQGAIPPAQLKPVSSATLAGIHQMLSSKPGVTAPPVTLDTKPTTKLAIQIGDITNLGKPDQPAAMAALINKMLAKVILNRSGSELFVEVQDQFILLNDFDPGTQQLQLTPIFNGLALQDRATGEQAAYVIAINGQTIATPNNTIILKPADWTKQAPAQDDAGNTIYQLTLTILQPAVVYNFRQGLWQDRLPEDEKATYNAVSQYMATDDSSAATLIDELPDWHLNMFKANGNNATLFIHGYNVAYGEFASCYATTQAADGAALASDLTSLRATPFKSTIYRDDDYMQALYSGAYNPEAYGSGDDKTAALNGKEAHKWFVNMEYNLNSAAGFDGKDYSKYTRLINIAWQGNPGAPTDYMAATTLAKFPATKIFKLIQQLNTAGIKINIMAHSLGNDVLMHVLDLCGQNGISVEHVFMWEPAIPDDSFDTAPRKYMPMNLGASSQALPYEYNYPNAQAGSLAMTVLYSDNDNILGAMPEEDGAVDSTLAWNAQMMHDFYYGIMIPDHSIGTRVGLSVANLLSTSPVAGPLVYALLQKMGISGIDSGGSDSARIQLLQSKMADPAAGIHLASVAEALFMLDQYGMPHIDQHKKLFSIYHIANLFVYPLSYFFQDGACEQFYTQWKGFYTSFKAPVNGTAQDLPFYPTLAAQQQYMRQNLKDAFNFLSLGMYLANQALNQGLNWNEASRLIKDAALSNQSLSEWLNDYAPYFEDETSNNIATILLTGILTDGAMPEAAMGYRGVPMTMQFGNYHGLDQKDPATGKDLLADHCAMMMPTPALMNEIYKRQLMQAAGTSFSYFGKYKEG